MEIKSNLINDDSFTAFPWKITDTEEALLMLSANVGQYFESDEFNYHDLRFRMRVYPNGMKKSVKEK